MEGPLPHGQAALAPATRRVAELRDKTLDPAIRSKNLRLHRCLTKPNVSNNSKLTFHHLFQLQSGKGYPAERPAAAKCDVGQESGLGARVYGRPSQSAISYTLGGSREQGDNIHGWRAWWPPRRDPQ